jgi:acyl carrier protein
MEFKMNESSNKLDKVKEIICEVLNIHDIDDTAKQEDFAEWDSLAYLSIISELEDQFEINVSSDNINSFDSVHNIMSNLP